MADFFGSGISGLLSAQRSLATTSHNISNVNTEGYTRQRAIVTSQLPTYSGAGYVGNGSKVVNVERIYSEFVDGEVIRNTSSNSQYQTYLDYARQLDNLVAHPEAGLNSAIEEFTSALQSLADDPSSIAARQVVLTQGDSLINRFNILDERMDNLRTSVNSQMRDIVDEVNSISSSIADLNRSIATAPGRADGILPHDLYDKRRQLLEQLSQYVSVQAVEQSNGALNIYVGKGQALVTNFSSVNLTTEVNEFDGRQLEIGYQVGTSSNVVTSLLSGGELGGLIDFREHVLTSAQNSVGRIAIAMGETFNTQHRLGMDLEFNLGGDLFTQPTIETKSSVNNTGTGVITTTIVDPNQLTDSDYLLSYDGANYTLTRLSDNTVTTPIAPGALPYTIDGVEFDLTAGVPNAGDKFLLRPTRAASRTIDMAIDNPLKLAAAYPINTDASLNNIGTGTLEVSSISNVTGAEFATAGQLTPPLLIEFDPLVPNQYSVYDNTVPAAPVLLSGPIAYNPNVGADVIADAGLGYGYEVRLTGDPGLGDQFTVDYNSFGVGDNRNALEIANLHAKNTMLNGTASYQEAYSQMVVNVGSSAHQAEINGSAQEVLLRQAVENRESISGVNLDEEAANLLKFQQAYQAATRVITIADELFNALISAAR